MFTLDRCFLICVKLKHDIVISSLQCYSVLSTIAQVLRKLSLKILASVFLMPYLSQTFESYKRVKIYTYSVNGFGLKKFLQLYGIYEHFYSLQIEHNALKIALCVQCYSVLYFHTAYYSVYGVNSYTSLNRNDYLYLKVAVLVIYLA